MAEKANFEMLVARKKAGLTQKELADAVGKSSIWISRIEQGKEKPTDTLAHEIATVLNAEADELFGDEKGQ